MKKIIIIISLLFLVTGCTNVKKYTFDQLVDNFEEKSFKTNIFHTGYKYYLPPSMSITSSKLANDIIKDSKNTYYLYIDFSSYYNKVENSYTKNDNSVYSKAFTTNDKIGYLEINLLKNKKYLVEIMYNYAKIEVMVDKDDCNRSILSAINILKSIEYNNSIIANIMGNDILSLSEEEFDIFKTHTKGDTYIQITDEDIYYENTIPDTDLIN